MSEKYSKEEVTEAIKKSINKWKRNASVKKLENVSINADDCPLCNLFFEGFECEGCPVSKHTGVKLCEETPYYNVVKFVVSKTKKENHMKNYKKACKEEIKFLEMLLDKELGNV